MLYLVDMIVKIPPSMDPEVVNEIKAREKAYSQQLQRDGKWRHLWRVVGEYSNVSIFDAESNDDLHTMLNALPLFPYMDIKVKALANHPSSIVQE